MVSKTERWNESGDKDDDNRNAEEDFVATGTSLCCDEEMKHAGSDDNTRDINLFWLPSLATKM